ncbi:MAG: LPS export ABC transporter periplasmic protein LptC [Candidatus Korobacteraceae bacterium]|jgi:lipopolysaccharide export system protein LptA
MPVSIPRLRIWFAVLALAAVAVVAGFYFHARMELRSSLKNLPGKLGIEIQQTSEGFSLSKSEGGRTLYTIRASKATQFKEGGRAELHDVNIVVYGRNSDRFDQIYGKDFEYDQQAGTVISKGEVFIDLQGNTEGQKQEDQEPPRATQNPIHLRAEGMVFNQKTELAETEGQVDFRVPQAAGTAHGATYDSKKNELTLHSAIDIQTSGAEPSHIQAVHGTITKEPRLMTLESAQMEGKERTVLADHAVMDLSPDNSIQAVHATGNVRVSNTAGMRLRSPAAEMKLGANNMVQTALFTGGVDFESETQGASGHSGEMLLHFVPASEAKGASRSQPPHPGKRASDGAPGQEKGSGSTALLKTIYASQGVTLRQAPKETSKDPQALAMTSNAMTFMVSQGRLLTTAQTEAAGELVITSAAAKSAGEQTVIDAQHFTAEFGDENRIRTAHGVGAVKVVSHSPGMPDKVSTSDTMVAQFAPGGEVSRVIQEGHFRYREGESSKSELGGRTSFAERATYSPADDSLTLQGSPRIVDGGMTVTADNIRLLRHSGEAFAQGNVKSTYSELKLQPNGALLATADPIHVTSRAMNAVQSSGLAHYTGAARLWQGSNIVEAQTIDFDQKARTIVALGDRKRPVNSVFLQVDGQGKATTMLVTAPKLNYADNEREARYSGGVTVHGQDGVMTADHADVFLNAVSAARTPGPSQLDHIIAYTHVLVQQRERRAEGEKMVYTAATGSYVMTGGAPMLSDPVNGTVRGDSLTFYSHDDRVVVEGDSASRAVTHTHASH